jgi:hypothetical protein
MIVRKGPEAAPEQGRNWGSRVGHTRAKNWFPARPKPHGRDGQEVITA